MAVAIEGTTGTLATTVGADGAVGCCDAVGAGKVTATTGAGFAAESGAMSA